MAKIGLFYSSTTGKTETRSEAIQTEFGGEEIVSLHEIIDVSGTDFDDYNCLIIGCPNWDIRELQSNWDGFYQDELDKINFQRKKVGYFGTGDQVGYKE